MYKTLIFISLFIFSLTHTVYGKVPVKGDPAPDFSLISVDGERVVLSSLKGKIVLIGMFHICVPCMKQALEFNKVESQLSSSGKLKILGINTSGDSKNAVIDYLKSFPEKVSFSYLLDPSKSVHENYSQRDMPTVLVIGPNGVIQARVPWVAADQLIEFIKKLL